ncbi:MAG: ATP-grasp domain-containing protein [Candidatus Omnitrophica bacterium]|nr:ATP-grasp domain-containing protein [Candidatus Omnitrophota bacterium]
MHKKIKVLLLFDSPYHKPRGYDFQEEFKDITWDTERDVYRALKECGYEVSLLGLCNDIGILFEEIKEFKPDVIFNLAEVFNQKAYLDKNVASLLEMLDIPYTGASPASLFICNNKALSKKILSFHKIKIPHFHTFYKKRRVWFPKRLKLPFIVKPLCEEASRGISQASIVDNESSFIERINFIHQQMNMDAIVEEYIDGRELYVSILGNRRTEVLPLREMKFGQFPEDEPRIATYKAKWDDNYREKWGIKSVFAAKLPNGADKKIKDICKRAYRALNMQSYARFDIRVVADGNVYIVEANANPCLAKCDEVAQAAEKIAISYNQLIRRIITLAFKRKQ